MKIILLGKNGMLGSMILFTAIRQGINIVALSRSEFDAMSMNVDSLLKYINNDCCVINCIGAIPQKNPSESEYRVLNEVFPHQLAAFCNSHKIPYIHISTNSVFSENKKSMSEIDSADATDRYGLSKLRGEPIDKAIIIRCSIIGFELAESKYGLLEWYCGESKEVNGYNDHMWNGITTYELACTIMKIIKARAFNPRLEHHYSENILSKYDILCAISKYLDNPAKVIKTYAGENNHTLSSIYNHTKHGTIESQLESLFAIRDEFKGN